MANGIPAAIEEAERWRLAGERLREEAPEVFGCVLVMLARVAIEIDEEDPQDITLSY